MDGGRAFCLIFCVLILTGYSIESYPLRIVQPSLNIIPKFYSISLKKSINLTDRKSKKLLFSNKNLLTVSDIFGKRISKIYDILNIYFCY